MFCEKAFQQILSHPSSSSSSSSSSTDKLPYSQNPSKAMATGFAMPVQQFTASPSQYTLYNGTRSQQTSPINSVTATPHNSSPTSPRTTLPPHLPAHTRQLRPPKSPLYVPAVLRPTDPPRRVLRQSPLTPPSSNDNSFDDVENVRTLSRRLTGDSGKFGLGAITEAEWAEGLGEVTREPTREHWKPDNDAVMCDDPSCTKYFGYITRKHHCRRCGDIFCHAHSSKAIPLDRNANHHPEGILSRSCDHCLIEYNRWVIARSSRPSSESSHEAPDAPMTPTVLCPTSRTRGAIGIVFGQKNTGTPESLGASVPRDWNWSTF